ncbi:MAG: glyoxylate/hydroxypyruvate reductase A [Bacteroidia bacterium]|nr:glyoxylate/hydroxypyruvate reductase A [Bacteroidia bacterium]
MSILLICNHKDPAPWAEALQKQLPSERIEIYPEIEDASSVEFILSWKAEAGIFDQFPNLRAVQSLGASVSHILDHQDLAPQIQIARIVDERLSQDMWEYVLAVVMAHLKRLDRYQELEKEKKWHPLPYKSIRDIHISFLGLGKIGAFVADKFSHLGFKVSGWSRTKKELEGIKTFEGEKGLIQMLERSDILVNLLPHTAETQALINEAFLERLPKGAYLINAGRGETLVEEDLLKVLDKGLLSAAYLDVFQQEPLAIDHPFWQHPKIRISPHIASITNIESASQQIVQNYRRLKSGEALLHSVSPQNGY